MRAQPKIGVLQTEYGTYPWAAALNWKFPRNAPIMILTLEIAWDPADPIKAVSRLEETLLSFSPAFRKHECRGAEAYHVFASKASAGAPVGSQSAEPFNPRLALAHLIEHAVIDFQCVITDEKRCSGVTAEHRRHPGRFDLLIECRDPSVGRLSLALALSWLTASIQSEHLGAAEREILEAARLVYRRPYEGLSPPAVAQAMTWTEEKATRALGALLEIGYLAETPYAMNLSGAPQYRIRHI
jgi:hypothetical protein